VSKSDQIAIGAWVARMLRFVARAVRAPGILKRTAFRNDHGSNLTKLPTTTHVKDGRVQLMDAHQTRPHIRFRLLRSLIRI